MALIEEYHVTADMYPVDPNNNPNITEGQVVTLNADGNVVLRTAGVGWVLGIAGDSTAQETEAGELNTAYAADLVVSGSGATRRTENRVSDVFNETLSSSKITVYNNGGKFHTDQYELLHENGLGTVSYFVGAALHASANGKLTADTTLAANPEVGRVVVDVREYPSGVPGTDAPDGNLSLGSYLTFHLRV